MKKLVTVLIFASILLVGCQKSQNEPKQSIPPLNESTSSKNTPFTNKVIIGNMVKSIDTNTKQYTNEESGLSLQYPSTWSLWDDIDDIKIPHLFIDDEAYYIKGVSTECGELGGCQEDVKKLKQDIEDGTAPGIITFQGGKGSLIATCAGNQGWDFIPSPFYEFKFFKGDRIYSIRLNDLSHRLNKKEGACAQNSYIKKIQPPDEQKLAEYKPYDDFVALIKNTLVLK